ncbi:MAG: SpoIVB peptidase [bacterium]|jgi:stage IV sporulation protein B
MKNKRQRKICGIMLALLIICISLTPQFQSIVTFPQKVRFLEGVNQSYYFGFPVNVYLRSNRNGIVKLNGTALSSQAARVNLGAPLDIEPLQRGAIEIEVLLFGVPIRKMMVDVIPPVKVIPGGHSIGVVLLSHGVIVVGLASVGSGRAQTNPAQLAGLKIGDTILRVNGERVESIGHLAELVNQFGQLGKSLHVEYKRGSEFLTTTLKPVFCSETGRFRIGLYVRDGANGVGTLSFYEPETGAYGALGHIITDLETNQPLNVEEGSVVRATISGIQPGMKGQPGEKIGIFTNNEDILGNITKNTTYGLFGTLNKNLQNPFYPEPIPVALASQVKTGPAEMLTVINENKIEKFQIKIERIFDHSIPTDKSFVIKIIDEKLLAATGGIIQGMSGSPIIQNGHLVGIVTHVFVNDPAKGYGIMAEWMLNELEISPLAKAKGKFLRFFSIFEQENLIINRI